MATGGLFIDELGGKGDALVLVHGLGGSSNTWYPQSQVLTRDLRVVAYDLAGSGRSPTRDDTTIESHVEDLLAIVRQVAGEGRVHLAGHSLGTIVCQHFAVTHAARVASLALLGPFAQPPEPARNGLRDRAAKARAEGMRGIADAVVLAGTADDTKVNQPAAAAFVRESVMAQSPEGYARNCEALSRAQSAELGHIACPTLLMTGDQDRTAPPDVGAAMKSAIAGAEHQVLTACGHWPTIERAKVVNYAMTVFYARQRQASAA